MQGAIAWQRTLGWVEPSNCRNLVDLDLVLIYVLLVLRRILAVLPISNFPPLASASAT